MAAAFEWILIDGYSLLYRLEPRPRLAGDEGMVTRERLIRTIEDTALRYAPRATVVFDGQGGDWAPRGVSGPVEIYYSARGQTADAVIERWVVQHPRPSSILVVTADRHERDAVTAAGAHGMGCRRFLEQCDTDRRRLTRRLRQQPGRQRGGPCLGEFFPEDRAKD